MSDEMKAVLEQYLTRLLEALDKGATWTADQVPLLVQEKLAFDFWWAVAGVIGGLAMLIVGIFLCLRIIRSTADGDYADPIFILPAFGSVGGAVMTLVNLHTALQIALAPRLYILEWLRASL